MDIWVHFCVQNCFKNVKRYDCEYLLLNKNMTKIKNNFYHKTFDDILFCVPHNAWVHTGYERQRGSGRLEGLIYHLILFWSGWSHPADDSVDYRWEIWSEHFIFKFNTIPRNLVSLVGIKFSVMAAVKL